MTANTSTLSWAQHEGVTRRQKLSDTAVVITMQMSPKYIAVSLDNKTVHVFNSDGEPLHVLGEHSGNVWSLAVNNDTLLSGEIGGNIQSWDIPTGTLKRTFPGHTDTVRCLAFYSPTSFISASRDTTLKLWSLTVDADADACIATLSGHTEPIISLAVDPTFRLAVSGSHDGTCRVWNLAAHGACLATLVGHKKEVRAVAFALGAPAEKEDGSGGKGQRVVSGGVDGKVMVWDAWSGARVAVLDGHRALVGHVLAVTDGGGDGGTIVTAGADGAIRAWELGCEWRLRWALTEAHEYAVTSVKVEGGYMVSGGSDGRVRLWELEAGRMLKEVGEKAEAVWSVGFKEGSQKGVVVVSRQSGLSVLDVWTFQ
ncbi:MAG: hypothetical protein Q9163_001222 [Psora crenata]